MRAKQGRKHGDILQGSAPGKAGIHLIDLCRYSRFQDAIKINAVYLPND